MNMLLAFVVGFALGGQGGSRDRDEVFRSLTTIRSSEEMAAFTMFARSQVGRTLRQMANLVDGDGAELAAPPDLVDRVRALVGP